MLATPTTLHCRVVDIFKQQQRQVPCSERAQQLLTDNWQLATGSAAMWPGPCCVYVMRSTSDSACVCVCVCKLPACRYLTQDSPHGRLLPSATAMRSGTNKVRIV